MRKTCRKWNHSVQRTCRRKPVFQINFVFLPHYSQGFHPFWLRRDFFHSVSEVTHLQGRMLNPLTWAPTKMWRLPTAWTFCLFDFFLSVLFLTRAQSARSLREAWVHRKKMRLNCRRETAVESELRLVCVCWLANRVFHLNLSDTSTGLPVHSKVKVIRSA